MSRDIVEHCEMYLDDVMDHSRRAAIDMLRSTRCISAELVEDLLSIRVWDNNIQELADDVDRRLVRIDALLAVMEVPHE